MAASCSVRGARRYSIRRTSRADAIPRVPGHAATLSSRLRRIAPYFLIGPISGPLLAGVVINFREGRPVLASLYAIALVQYVILLPAVLTRMGLNLVV